MSKELNDAERLYRELSGEKSNLDSQSKVKVFIEVEDEEEFDDEFDDDFEDDFEGDLQVSRGEGHTELADLGKAEMLYKSLTPEPGVASLVNQKAKQLSEISSRRR